MVYNTLNDRYSRLSARMKKIRFPRKMLTYLKQKKRNQCKIWTGKLKKKDKERAFRSP